MVSSVAPRYCIGTTLITDLDLTPPTHNNLLIFKEHYVFRVLYLSHPRIFWVGMEAAMSQIYPSALAFLFPLAPFLSQVQRVVVLVPLQVREQPIIFLNGLLQAALPILLSSKRVQMLTFVER